MQILTVTQAANLLGVSTQRVRAMIATGIIEATRHGSSWIVDLKSVEARKKNNPGPGQPKKGKS